jgi:hypothetical protein
LNQPPRTTGIEAQNRITDSLTNRATATPVGAVPQKPSASDQASGAAMAVCGGIGHAAWFVLSYSPVIGHQ